MALHQQAPQHLQAVGMRLSCHVLTVRLQGLQLKRHIDATLGQGNLIEAVRLPPGEDIKEWLAVNTVDFYNAISVLYSTLAEFCTESNCEVMSAGSKVRYEFRSWVTGIDRVL
jgi:MOB kinase activator 1